MNKLTTLAIIMALQVLVCADPSNERQQRDLETLYERMAARLFAEFYEIRHSDLPKEEKQKWVHSGANAAFQYWLTTRKGGIRKSSKVEAAIAFFYEDALESKMTTGFSDPMYRMDLDEPENIGVPGFSKMTQIQYKEYVGEFQAFLNEVLKKRRARQDDVKKRVEALEREAQPQR